MWVWDSESVLDFGRQEGLLLQDGVGIRELAGILDPVPVAAGQAFPSNSLPGDPFSDAGRPW